MVVRSRIAPSRRSCQRRRRSRHAASAPHPGCAGDCAGIALETTLPPHPAPALSRRPALTPRPSHHPPTLTLTALIPPLGQMRPEVAPEIALETIAQHLRPCSLSLLLITVAFGPYDAFEFGDDWHESFGSTRSLQLVLLLRYCACVPLCLIGVGVIHMQLRHGLRDKTHMQSLGCGLMLVATTCFFVLILAAPNKEHPRPMCVASTLGRSPMHPACHPMHPGCNRIHSRHSLVHPSRKPQCASPSIHPGGPPRCSSCISGSCTPCSPSRSYHRRRSSLSSRQWAAF